MSRCRPGDLAVVIEAKIKSNLGRIVRVIALHDGTGPLGAIGPKPVWLVSASTAMNWRIGSKRLSLKSGPVSDSCLQPIRGAKAASKKRRKSQTQGLAPAQADAVPHTPSA